MLTVPDRLDSTGLVQMILGAAVSTTTWNPSDKDAGISLSNGNLTATGPSNAYSGVRSVASASSGKKYWEVHVDAFHAVASQAVQGIADSTASLTNYLGNDAHSVGWAGNGPVYINNVNVLTIQGWTGGDTLCFALDIGNLRIWFRTNGGNWNNNGANDPATNVGGIDVSAITPAFFAACMTGNGGAAVSDVYTANFGATSYAQTPPSGFGNW